MRIIIKKSFTKELNKFIRRIEKDKPEYSKRFEDKIISKIEKIAIMPYKHKKYGRLNNEKIRAMIYIGYKVVFEINEEENIIIIFAFYGNSGSY